MISSSIYTNEDLGKYPEGIQKALEYLMSRDFTQMEPGTYAIDGKDIYAMVMDITTCAPQIKDQKYIRSMQMYSLLQREEKCWDLLRI
mgnify:CR=1 FL=1